MQFWRLRVARLTNSQHDAGDFSEIGPPSPFDVVSYFDGFGVGTDDDQRRLLRRITGWLSSGGCALIDIYNPYHFARIDGVEYEESDQVQESPTWPSSISRTICPTVRFFAELPAPSG